MPRDDARQTTSGYPENPPLVRLWRGDAVESQHRGAWCLVDAEGRVLEGAGGFQAPIHARSSVKCLQALPLLETGAADRHGMGDDELALALASHDAEDQHTRRVEQLLARLGLAVDHLRCGPQPPGSAEARDALKALGRRPTSLHNNCSGKHAGFLALALHLGVSPERYLEPDSAGQRLVRQAVLEMARLEERDLSTAIDGCSAPTFRLPLVGLATAFARVANPAGLEPARRAACERMLLAVERHPELIAGSKKRLCTDIARATGGRLFPTVGGEAVYALGARGRGLALAAKIDDGGNRALHALVVALLERFELATPEELARLEPWRERVLRNWAGLETGRTEVLA